MAQTQEAHMGIGGGNVVLGHEPMERVPRRTDNREA